MSKHYIEVMDGLAQIESQLRLGCHSLGHHAGIVGDGDDLAPCPEASKQLLHALWDLLTEALQKVEELRGPKPADDEPGREGPLGPLPPDIAGALGEGPSEAI